MKRFLKAFLLVCCLAVGEAAHADWGTSTAEPLNLSNACFYASDGVANMRGLDYICTWAPDAGEPGWYDTLGWRANHCDGAPGVGDVGLTTTSGKYCTRVHGLVSTDAEPNGFRMGRQYIRWVGLFGIDMDDWWATEEIGSFTLGPNSHVTFCAGDLTGSPSTPCQSTSFFFRTDTTPRSGTLPFVVAGLTIGTNEAAPPVCVISPVAFLACPSTHHKSGLPVFVGGDGQPRSGGYAVIGNPITGGSGAPCLSHDQRGQVAVAVYPVAGSATTNPDGTPASVALCPP